MDDGNLTSVIDGLEKFLSVLLLVTGIDIYF